MYVRANVIDLAVKLLIRCRLLKLLACAQNRRVCASRVCNIHLLYFIQYV